MKNEVLMFGGGRIFISMKTIVLNRYINKATQHIKNFHGMLKAGVKWNDDEVHDMDRIFSTSWAGDERRHDVGFLIQWVSSEEYVEARLKKYEGNSVKKKLSEVKRWILKRVADNDVLMFEQWGSISSRRSMTVGSMEKAMECSNYEVQ